MDGLKQDILIVDENPVVPKEDNKENEVEVTYNPAEDEIVPLFRNCLDMQLIIKSTCPIYNGEKMLKVGDLVKYWEGEVVGPTTDITALLPDNTKAIRVTKILKIKELTTGFTVEGVVVEFEGELILAS